MIIAEITSLFYGRMTGWWFLATPLKNMTSSVGMSRNPIYGKIYKMATKPPTRNNHVLLVKIGLGRWLGPTISILIYLLWQRGLWNTPLFSSTNENLGHLWWISIGLSSNIHPIQQGWTTGKPINGNLRDIYGYLWYINYHPIIIQLITINHY